MKYVPIIYNSFLGLGSVALMATYYWSFRHFSSESSGAVELLEGEALVILYSSPIWLGFIAFSLIFFKYLSLKKVVISFILGILVIFPIFIRSAINAL